RSAGGCRPARTSPGIRRSGRPADHHQITRFHSPSLPRHKPGTLADLKSPKAVRKRAVRTPATGNAVTGERLACQTEATVVEPAAPLRWLLPHVRSPGPRLVARR